MTMFKTVRFLLSIVIAIVSMMCASAQETTPDSVLIVARTEDFQFTGDGNSPEWSAASWIHLPKRIGDVGYKTRTKLLYSSTGIYCFFSCEDNMVTSTFQQDFSPLYREDVVEFFIWPDESLPLYLEYELSPHNYEVAVLIPNIDNEISGWKPWNYEGRRKSRHATAIQKNPAGNVIGWTAEIFLPYALLHPLRNVPPEKGTEWRINMYRIDYDSGTAMWTWAPIKNNFHDYTMFGRIRFGE